jgi:hypothetical protein
VWNCSWQQFEGYHYSNPEEIDKYVPSGDSYGYGASCLFEGYHYSNPEETDKYVPSGDSYGYGASCFVRAVAPRGCCNSAGLVGYTL